jgi:hypothetical protein
VPPGNWIEDFGGASGALYLNGVKGPSLWKPPLFAMKSQHAAACSGVVSSGRTRSASLKLTRASGGGRVGIGCVGEYHSVGTSPFGTGVSCTSNSGLPVVRSRMYMKLDLPTCAIAGTRVPFCTKSNSAPADGMSVSQRS